MLKRCLRSSRKQEKSSEASLSHQFFSITDVTDAWFDPDVIDAMKEFLIGNKPYVVAAAVVGVTGQVMKLFGRRLVLFDTVEQAKEWLADR